MGDVVLVANDGSAMGRAIEGVQGSLVSSSPPHGDPAWTHVAVYAGSGLLLEAVPRAGVRYTPVSHYAATRGLRLRRLRRGAGVIGPAEGERVVRAAAELFDHRYSYGSLVRLLMFQPGLANPSAFFCSTFVSVVYSLGVKVLLERLPVHRPLLPATLVLHPQLIDVGLEWRTPP